MNSNTCRISCHWAAELTVIYTNVHFWLPDLSVMCQVKMSQFITWGEKADQTWKQPMLRENEIKCCLFIQVIPADIYWSKHAHKETNTLIKYKAYLFSKWPGCLLGYIDPSVHARIKKKKHSASQWPWEYFKTDWNKKKNRNSENTTS